MDDRRSETGQIFVMTNKILRTNRLLDKIRQLKRGRGINIENRFHFCVKHEALFVPSQSADPFLRLTFLAVKQNIFFTNGEEEERHPQRSAPGERADEGVLPMCPMKKMSSQQEPISVNSEYTFSMVVPGEKHFGSHE